MRGLFTNDSFQLGAGEVLSGCAKRTRLLRIKSGSAWVTIEGAREDYWLSAGDALRVAAGRLVVVEAEASGLQMHTLGETAPVGMLAARAWRALRARFFGRASEPRSAGCCA